MHSPTESHDEVTINNHSNPNVQIPVNTINAPQTRKSPTSLRHFCLSATKITLYTLHNFTLTAALLYTLYLQLPSHIEVLYPDDKDNRLDKTMVLGIVTAITSLCSAAGGLFFGFISDLTAYRSVYIFIACMIWNVTMFARVLLLHSGIVVYTLLLCLGMLAYAAQLSPYNALLPLLFPQSQYGVVSGMIGVTSLVGTMLGVGVFAFVFDLVNEMWIIGVISVVGLATSILLCVLGEGSSPGGRCCKRRRKRNASQQQQLDSLPNLELDSRSESALPDTDDFTEKSDDSMADIFDIDEEMLNRLQSNPTRLVPRIFYALCRCVWHFPHEFIKAFRSRNFTLICLVRGSMYVALSISQTYTLYFLTDMLNDDFTIFGFDWIKSPNQALSIFMFVVIFLSLFASVFSGIMSDMFGARKYYVFVSALLCALAQIVIIVFRNFNVLLIAAFVSGIALGTFVSTDLALANDVLPSKEDAGKLLSIYTSFFSLPQLVVPPIAGVILSWANKWGNSMNVHGLGYIIIYSISSFWAVLCALFVLFISVKKKPKKRSKTMGGTVTDMGGVGGLGITHSGSMHSFVPEEAEYSLESYISESPADQGEEVDMDTVALHVAPATGEGIVNEK